ncbi:hypothetical protein FJ366_03845 [Candidatus Dependentiae bacterium]|nr:hypothetical protein [Candidatus Dependentiae bacterium]
MNFKVITMFLFTVAFGLSAQGQQGGSSVAIQQLQESYDAAQQVQDAAQKGYDNTSGLDKANALTLLNSAKDAAAKAKQALDRARAIASNAKAQNAQQ